MELVRRVAEAYLQTAEGSQAARLNFLLGQWEIQSRFEATEVPYEAPTADAARESLLSGRPLFFLGAPRIPVDAYTDAVSQMAAHVADAAGLSAEQVEALRAADFAAVIDEDRLAGAALSPDAFMAEVASELGADPSGPLTNATVAYVLYSALIPFLTGAAQEAQKVLGEFDQHGCTTGNCPVCGAAAALGRLGESSQLQGAERTLWCGLCHAEWGYERLRCARCGNRTPDKLRYTHVEGDAAHRLHLCDECHGYVKSVFMSDLDKPLSLVVEEVVVAPLDAIAAQQGYTATGDGGAGSC